MICFKQATKGQEELVQQLLKQKILELECKGIVQWKVQDVLWSTLQQEYNIEDFHFAYKDNTLAGCCCIVDYDPGYWKKDHPHSALYIHKVAVLDFASGQGVGDAMLAYFKEQGHKKKIKSVKLDVRAYKAPLRCFYERNGFKLVEIVDLNKGYQTALYEYIL